MLVIYLLENADKQKEKSVHNPFPYNKMLVTIWEIWIYACLFLHVQVHACVCMYLTHVFYYGWPKEWPEWKVNI